MIKNAEHVGYSTLQELSEEVRAAQTDGARTGRIFDVNNLDADTRMSLPFGMGKLLAEGHTLTVDYAGNINLSDNPDAQTRAGNGRINALLDNLNARFVEDRLREQWGLGPDGRPRTIPEPIHRPSSIAELREARAQESNRQSA